MKKESGLANYAFRVNLYNYNKPLSIILMSWLNARYALHPVNFLLMSDGRGIHEKGSMGVKEKLWTLG